MANLEQMAIEQQFSLPMHTMFSLSKTRDGVVAHALNFDLVAVGKTDELALAKLRASVKQYIEHGLRSGWQGSILHSAPPDCWSKINLDTRLRLGEPLHINRQNIITQIVEDSLNANEYDGVGATA